MAPSMGLIYSLRQTLYVALTNQCNGVTLVASRGPGFHMPASAGFAPLLVEPSASEVVEAVAAKMLEASIERCKQSPYYDGLVYAGIGEPLLRLDVLEEASQRLHTSYGSAFKLRINTNGMVHPGARAAVVARLLGAGISSVSVALASADAAEWERLMQPASFAVDDGNSTRGAQRAHCSSTAGTGSPASSTSSRRGPRHEHVCGFVSALSAAGCDVECTAVAAPGVELDAVRSLAESLGATFRERSWHPADG